MTLPDAMNQSDRDAEGGIATAAAEWPDVEQLFGVRGEPSRSWCRFFALTGPEWNDSAPGDRKKQLREKFDGGAPACAGTSQERPVASSAAAR